MSGELKIKKKGDQIQYSNRENVNTNMCLEFWEKELKALEENRDTKIVYEKIDAESYIKGMIAKHQ